MDKNFRIASTEQFEYFISENKVNELNFSGFNFICYYSTIFCPIVFIAIHNYRQAIRWIYRVKHQSDKHNYERLLVYLSFGNSNS